MGRYKWDKTNHVLVPISTGETSNFVGTSAEWADLSSSEKAAFKTVDLTDDFNGSPIDSIPTSGSDNVVSSGGVYDFIARSASEDVIETIGAVSQTSYSIGDYFLGNDGYFYVATSAITANTTVLNSGTSGNCSKTSVAAKLNSLSTQISNLESKVNDKYLLLGTKVITLATGNGSRTCNTLMTLALTALNAIVPSSEVAGATHMKPVYAVMPYGDGASTRTILIPESSLSPVASFSSSSYKFIKIDASSTGDGITLWNADFASTNRWFLQSVTTSAISDFLTRKPSNGTTLDVCLEFYAKY